MKKMLAIVLAFVIVAVLSVTAYAALSPVSVGEYEIIVGSYATGVLGDANYTINADGTVTLIKAASSDYAFEGWKITGKYEVVSGNEMSDVYVIRPKSDLRIIEMYDNPAAKGEAGYSDDSPTSPVTGSNLLALGAIALLSLSGAVVAKKRLA